MFQSVSKAIRDMTCGSNGKVVQEKVGGLLAHLVASGVVLSMAVKGTLTADIFGVYLAYAAAHAAFGLRYKNQKNQLSAQPKESLDV